MRFEVMPAIDVSGGRLAILAPDGPQPVGAFGGDPVAAARAYVDAGARWVHVVDMDLAFEGEARNIGVVRSVSSLGAHVQASGGVVRDDDVDAMLRAGARRVVLGSGALSDDDATTEAIDRFGVRLIVGVEVEGDRIRSRGMHPVDLPLVETLGWLTAAGTPAFLVTAVDRVGRATGPDLVAIGRVVRSGRPTMAAGGISTLDDVRAVRRTGAAGAVIGRAALEGDLDLRAALTALG
ncbi:MAG: HisA/HisF-related TIM barrel protein [Actinomycetota bacterium]